MSVFTTMKSLEKEMKNDVRMPELDEFKEIYKAEQNLSKKPGLMHFLLRKADDAVSHAENLFFTQNEILKRNEKELLKEMKNFKEDKTTLYLETEELAEQAEKLESKGANYTNAQLEQFYEIFKKALKLQTLAHLSCLNDEFLGGDADINTMNLIYANVWYIILLISWPERTKESEKEREESRRRDGKAKEIRG